MNKLTFLFSSLLLASAVQAQESDQSDVLPEATEQARGEHRLHRRGHGKMHKLMLEKVDTNKDGQIDLNEFLAHAEARFQKMDINSDGYVTKEEGREVSREMRARMKEKRAEIRKKRRELRDGVGEQDAQDQDNDN